MAVNVMVRDMDLALPNAHDARRLEVLGLPMYGGAQLVSHSGRWDCQTWYREHRWHHPGPGPAQKRAYIPGVGRSAFACAPCGLGRRGRQVVGGDADVPPHFGTRESPLRAANLEEESGAGLEDALGRNPGVQRCSRVLPPPSSTSALAEGLMGMSPEAMTWRMTFATCASVDRGCPCLIHESV